jgi:2-polyprenyl-6-hydroxyphenyl methylase / 3-demethylubiquinone-9 3-methyltransferase
MRKGTRETQAFYDSYWPSNVPDYKRTQEHVFSLLPDVPIAHALDAGAGTGVCTLALAERASLAIGVDLSKKSLLMAHHLASQIGRTNTLFSQGDLQQLPFDDETFDLVYSWGVVDHTVDPQRTMSELVRVLCPGGYLIVAVYLRTWLTPLHELSRYICLYTPFFPRRWFIRAIGEFVRFLERKREIINVRDDNVNVEAQAEDWFFAPVKHFFTIDEMRQMYTHLGMSFGVLVERTGRFRSSSDFIVRGQKLT